MINTTIENLTEPSRVDNPLTGDKIKRTNTKTGLVFIASHHDPAASRVYLLEDSKFFYWNWSIIWINLTVT